MPKKVLITLLGNDVAPRFDLATEVMIFAVTPEGRVEEERIMVLPQASAEKLCHMIITEDIRVVICGGIEEEYYQYLIWKRIAVHDAVIGPVDRVRQRFCRGQLQPGDILYGTRREERTPEK
jgi:predicted Fe-Mo cluster-binding NifX family protein